MDPMSGFDIRPVTVHCSTKHAYTSEITFLALNPWKELSTHKKKL